MTHSRWITSAHKAEMEGNKAMDKAIILPITRVWIKLNSEDYSVSLYQDGTVKITNISREETTYSNIINVWINGRPSPTEGD